MHGTTVSCTLETKQKLAKLKNHPTETYEQLFVRLILKIKDEDDNLLTDKDMKDIQKSIAGIAKGKYKTQEQMKEKYGMK